jgi:hypothetical protein
MSLHTFLSIRCQQETGLTCGSPHDPKSLERCNMIRKILSLEIVCLKVHMGVVRLCGNVGLGKGRGGHFC